MRWRQRSFKAGDLEPKLNTNMTAAEGFRRARTETVRDNPTEYGIGGRYFEASSGIELDNFDNSRMWTRRGFWVAGFLDGMALYKRSANYEVSCWVQGHVQTPVTNGGTQYSLLMFDECLGIGRLRRRVPMPAQRLLTDFRCFAFT